VAKTGTYYCVIEQTFVEIQPGVYRINGLDFAQRLRYINLSNKIWLQGPKGDVKIVKDRTGFGYTGYVTNNPEYMKEFMWAKLKAQTVN
jgi:hypothetical protein